MPAPIALFVYSRLEHTRRTVEALRANVLASESDLFVFADAPRSASAADAVQAVRDFVRTIEGFRSVTVIERETNLGVDASVIDGVTTMCDRHGEVIVLEDDLVTSPWFLTFMNECLRRYRDDARVMQVGGFMFPIDADVSAASILPYITCWGWATWKRAWNLFDPRATLYSTLETDPVRRRGFNLNNAYDYFGMLKDVATGKSTAWDIRWYATVFAAGGVGVFPNQSLVDNIGFDGTGVHGQTVDHFENRLATAPIASFPLVKVNKGVWRSIENFLWARQPHASIRSRVGRIAHRLAGWRMVPR
jgi:hypothetical protein